MNDEELTAEEIEKALKCCNFLCSPRCEECPVLEKALLSDEETCEQIVARNCIDLINRQKAEIARLKEENQILSRNADTAFQDGLNECRALFETEIKLEAYKEFAERLCEGKVSNDKTVIETRVLLKEMAGEE